MFFGQRPKFWTSGRSRYVGRHAFKSEAFYIPYACVQVVSSILLSLQDYVVQRRPPARDQQEPLEDWLF